jgi:hypothetical protein
LEQAGVAQIADERGADRSLQMEVEETEQHARLLVQTDRSVG